MPSSTLLARHGFRSAGRGSAAREFFHPGTHVSELAHRRAFRIASTRVVPGDDRTRQHKADHGHLLPRPAQHPAAGSRAPGHDAGLKGSGRHAKPSESRFVIIQDPVCLCGATRCSDRLSGPRGGIERPSGPTGQCYAGSRIRTAGNSAYRTFVNRGSSRSPTLRLLQIAQGEMARWKTTSVGTELSGT